MSSSIFNIKEHTIEGQHIREYPRATANSQEEILHLAFKQYIPKTNPTPQPGDLTIIAAHANGFGKELYEPLWEDLVHILSQSGVRVRSIWIADVAWQGASGILNQSSLGNDPSWFDHSRDLLLAVNHFRREMPRPIIGVGHSFGANTIINLALLHPRLLTSIVCLDPVVSHYRGKGPRWGLLPMRGSAYRRDLWPSLSSAAASFAKNPFYAGWDPRVTERWNRYCLRETPTGLYPDEGTKGMVTLTTTKHQEVFTYYRPQHQVYDPSTGRRVPDVLDRSKLPDADPGIEQFPDFVFYNTAGGPQTAGRLPNLRPGVLYIFGEESNVNPPDIRQEKLDITGVGVGGSGGVKGGRVESVTLKGVGHLVPMEATMACARHAGAFIVKELERAWRVEEREFERWREGNTLREKQTVGREYDGWLGMDKLRGGTRGEGKGEGGKEKAKL